MNFRFLTRRRFWKIAGLVASLVFLLIAAAFFCPEFFLSVRSKPVTADAMVVLGGDAGQRATLAAELYRAGRAPWVIVSGAGDTEEKRRRLLKGGVPASAIEKEDESISTQQNAEMTIRKLRSRGARRVIIVTSWFHSRRALNCFEHYAPEIEFLSLPTQPEPSSSFWPDKQKRNWIFSEYLKLGWYLVRYGIWPL